MSEIVIDASAALAWTLKSQRTVASLAFLSRAAEDIFISPFVFPWETRNVMLRLLHRGRLTRIDYDEAVAGLGQYAIQIETPFAAEQVELLALREKLSLFDAAYLSLALGRGLSLASRDDGLLAAAERSGVRIWDLR